MKAIILFSACEKKAAYPGAPVSADEVRVVLAHLEESLPVFYSFGHDGKRVNFFVIKANGVVGSYLDACRKCSKRKKGYRFVDDRLECIACGESYPPARLNGVGSCYPIPIKGSLQGRHYAIKVSELIKARKYF
jgi:uncharacterized membrane protein